jgi:hypothetical protein
VRRKLDEAGNEVIDGYEVATVMRKVDGQLSVETAQGKRYKHEKNVTAYQSSLFDTTG